MLNNNQAPQNQSNATSAQGTGQSEPPSRFLTDFTAWTMNNAGNEDVLYDGNAIVKKFPQFLEFDKPEQAINEAFYVAQLEQQGVSIEDMLSQPGYVSKLPLLAGKYGKVETPTATETKAEEQSNRQ